MTDRFYSTAGHKQERREFAFTECIAHAEWVLGEAGSPEVILRVGRPAIIPSNVEPYAKYYCPLEIRDHDRQYAGLGIDSVDALARALMIGVGFAPVSYKRFLLGYDHSQEQPLDGIAQQSDSAAPSELAQENSTKMVAERVLTSKVAGAPKTVIKIARGDEFTGNRTLFQIGNEPWVTVVGKDSIHSIISTYRTIVNNLGTDVYWLSESVEEVFPIVSLG